MDDSYTVIEDTVRDTFARTVWSHKIQEKQADLYQQQYKAMQTVSIVCASMTSVGILSTFFSINSGLRFCPLFCLLPRFLLLLIYN
jgi:hypothetical protein